MPEQQHRHNGGVRLTPRQRDVLAWIAGYVQRYGYSPTIREGQAAFGLRSPHGFRCHVLALASKGLVTSDAGLCRSLRLADGVTIGDITVPDEAAHGQLS